MNVDRLLQGLGLSLDRGALAAGALPLVALPGRAVTLSTTWSAAAMDVAWRRGGALVVLDDGDGDGDPHRAAAPCPPVRTARRPWPIAVCTTSPWAVGGADLGVLVGADGPADHAGLDEAAAADLVLRFLDLAGDADPQPPAGGGSLLDVVPFPLDGAYPVEAVLAAVVDGGSWVELQAGAAPEVLTALARVAGRSVGIVASRPSQHGGRLGAAGCDRVARMVAWCERSGRPLLSLVDTAGAVAPQDVDDLAALTGAAAAMRTATATKVVVVLGRAVGLAATVLGAVGGRADVVLPWPRASYAPAAPVGGQAGCPVEVIAREGDVMDVVHPDDTRARVIEAFELCRGAREHGR